MSVSRPEPEPEGSSGPRPTPSATPNRRSLGQAVVTAVVLLGLVVGSAALGPGYLFVLVAAVVLLALLELLEALRLRGHHLSIAFGLACGLALMVAAYLGGLPLLGAVIAVTSIGALGVALLPGRPPGASTGAAWTVLGVTWITGGGAGAALILRIDDGGLVLLLAMVLIVAGADIGAFFVGSLFGRHKMAPSVSPGKSWEGLFGGLAAALLVGAVSGEAIGQLGPLRGLGFGALCGLVGPLGDLAESLVKREIGVKDSSRLLPGHGGFLDRLDAMVLCAPVVFAYLRLVL